MFEEINIFTIKNILIYVLIINLIGLFVMWLDKNKAKRGAWRIPEKTIFIITLIGGGIGTICGMYSFRHKTKKIAFSVGLPAILILETILIICMFLV